MLLVQLYAQNTVPRRAAGEFMSCHPLAAWWPLNAAPNLELSPRNATLLPRRETRSS